MAVPELEDSGRSVVSGFFGWIGALSSVALVGGLIWWAYDLATRDARQVPVVRALEGPMSAPPEAPGGYQAAHQGLAVNQVASDGETPPISDTIALAPEPTGVTEEDRPQAELADPTNPDVIRDSVNNALAELRAVLGGEDEENGTPTDGAPVAEPVQPQPVRPAPRPDADLVTRAALSVNAAPALAAVATDEVSPSSIPTGTRLVQLGAFDTQDLAHAEWTRLNGLFADYMKDKQRVIEPALVGESTIFRLRAHGFSDLADARNFCSALIAEHADCIPVLTR